MAVGVAAAEELEDTMYAVLAGQTLHKQVGLVLLAADLDEFDGVVANSLLDPKALRVDVSQVAEPLATTDAHVGNAVGPYLYRYLVAEVA